jgi:hypothetical protein
MKYVNSDNQVAVRKNIKIFAPKVKRYRFALSLESTLITAFI